MAEIYGSLIGQHGQLLQRMPHIGRGALEQAPTAQGKQRIGGKQQLAVGQVIANMARCMTWGFDDVDAMAAPLEAVPVAHRTVEAGYRDGLVARADDLATKAFLQGQVCFDMVAMMVRGEDMGEAPAATFCGAEDRFQLGRVDRGRQIAVRTMKEHAEVVAPAHENFQFERFHAENPIDGRCGECSVFMLEVQRAPDIN